MNEELIRLQSGRVNDLKSYKTLVKTILAENINAKKGSNPNWRARVIDHNISCLKEYLTEINKELKDKEAIKRYALGMQGNVGYFNEFLTRFNVLDMLGNVSNYTVPSSLRYDINWLNFISLDEKFQISISSEPPILLEKYWEDVINRLLTLSFPTLKLDKHFESYISIISDAINLAKSGSFLTSNIICFTVVESLVRELCRRVYQHQNPTKSTDEVEVYVNGFSSLEILLRTGDFKNDIELETSEVVAYYDYINEEVIKEAKILLKNTVNTHKKVAKMALELKNEMSNVNITDELRTKRMNEIILISKINTDEFHLIEDLRSKINIKIRLHFLIRQFKEDRNEVIHGNFANFNTKWKNVIYFSALIEIVKTTKEYDGIYRHFKN